MVRPTQRTSWGKDSQHFTPEDFIGQVGTLGIILGHVRSLLKAYLLSSYAPQVVCSNIPFLVCGVDS